MCDDYLRLAQRDAKSAEIQSVDELVTIDAISGLKKLPHWLAQPYFRPLPPDPTASSDDSGKKSSSGKRVHSITVRETSDNEDQSAPKRTKLLVAVT